MIGWKQLGLSIRIYVILLLFLGITFAMGVTAIWYAGQFNVLFHRMVSKDMQALDISRELANALANQKGFVTYYFLDGDPKWLNELAVHRRTFQTSIEQAYALNPDPDMKQMLDRIRTNYTAYIQGKDRVIELYQKGDRQSGEQLHWKVRQQYSKLYDLCELYQNANKNRIEKARERSRLESKQLMTAAAAFMAAVLMVSILLALFLVSQIIMPIRRLSRKAAAAEDDPETGDEVSVLSRRVYGLMEDRDRTLTELQQSKALLMNSEKMALVGKLATEVAHSIRNPMTSINMRLFSLKRNLQLSEIQKEDFEVVAEEMRRLDNIVRNFLEFSRPHKLKKRKVLLSDIIDMTIDLLSYRLDLHSVKVHWKRPAKPPPIEADPELLKEVFVNLVVNACEAIENNGDIEISEEEVIAENIGRAVRVRVSDNGPGISEELQGRVLEPFETTKPDGTGLGLFIAVRIIEEHGGRLTLQSVPGRGATFTIILPVMEEKPS